MFKTRCNFLDFPIEIQEMILYQLDLRDLFLMSRVCKLWHEICEWIAREKFSKYIPEECIQEVENSGAQQEDVWLTATNYQYLQKCVTKNEWDQSKNVIAELNEKHTCFCIYGPLIFVGCISGEILVYNTEESTELVHEFQPNQRAIFQMEVMKKKNLLLAQTCANELLFISLPYKKGKAWVYEMILLKTNLENYNGKLHSERNFSICGTIVAMATDVRQVCVFQVTSQTKNTVELMCLSNYISNEPVGQVSLWKDEVLIVFKTGEILRWCLSSQVSFLSERYHELHYENPIWIFRGRIFCSTIFSFQLLGYWHMDRGAKYWLMGKPASDLIRCRDLGTVEDSDSVTEDVLCVCLKQRLLACGTKNGKILLYYLSDTFFSLDEFNLNGNEHLSKEFNRHPDLVIKTKERPISKIQMEFSENSIIVYTWPYQIHGRPELKGLLQCIVLAESCRGNERGGQNPGQGTNYKEKP